MRHLNGELYGKNLFVKVPWKGKEQSPKSFNEAYNNSDLKKYCKMEENISEVVISSDGKVYQSSGAVLQKSISTWYQAFRNIAIVVELSMLVYVGIKIMLSSTADKRAKYKRFFVDWLVALCMLFILHYIMVFLVTFSQEISKIFIIGSGDKDSQSHAEYNILADLPENSRINLKKNGKGETVSGEILLPADGEGGSLPPKWSMSFMGYMRLQAGLYNKVAGQKNLAYAIIYLVLVVYTIMFTLIYIKRVLYMAFLTMIAPLIAVTYPIDRMKDQKAQAYGLWLKEYTYNALIQPVHLILYTMLISNVMNTVKDHPIYALVAMGFLLQGEKMIREMFGFNKASTVGALTKAAGGAAVMSAVNKMSSLNRRKTQESEEQNIDKVRTADTQEYMLPPMVNNKYNGAQPNTTVNTNQGSGTNTQESRNQNTTEATTYNGAQPNTSNPTKGEQNLNNGKNVGDNTKQARKDLEQKKTSFSQKEEKANQEFKKLEEQKQGLQADLEQIDKELEDLNEEYNNIEVALQNPNLTPEQRKKLEEEKEKILNRMNISKKQKLAIKASIKQIDEEIVNGKKDLNKEHSTNIRTTGSRVASGLLNVGSYYRKKALKSNPIRFIGKLSGKVLGAATLGTAGLIAGISSGSLKDTFTYTTGAAAVGSKLGGTLSENLMDDIHANKEAFSRGYLGEEDYTNKQLDKKFVKNEEIAKFVNNESLYPEMRGNIIQETRRERLIYKDIQTYRKAGITDNKKIMKAMKRGLTPQEGIYTIELAERLGTSGWNNYKIRMIFIEDYEEALRKKGLSEEQIKKIMDNIPKLLFKNY